MEAIAFIIQGLAWKAAVAEVGTVDRYHRSRQQAAIHLDSKFPQSGQQVHTKII